MKVVITGAGGFIGKNLRARLLERKDVEVVPVTRSSSAEDLGRAVASAGFVFHLAGVNRPKDPRELVEGNVESTRAVCDAVARVGRAIPVLYASSIQAELDNPYGASKRAAERELCALHEMTRSPVHIFRLPNVFGKWCRPSYNSVVATFCHNAIHDLPLSIHDASATMRLVYIDDVTERFVKVLDGEAASGELEDVSPVYTITVGELADRIRAFRDGRTSLVSERVGGGLIRALYATYVSYLPPKQFGYAVPAHEDPRGMFVEVLKTKDSGQFSFFTAHPGVTRGAHYHHSKTEKFLVVRGEARFRFRHILTGERHELFTSGSKPEIVDTIPGWAHDITNVGRDELAVMLWANELFDRDRPDTFPHEV